MCVCVSEGGQYALATGFFGVSCLSLSLSPSPFVCQKGVAILGSKTHTFSGMFPGAKCATIQCLLLCSGQKADAGQRQSSPSVPSLYVGRANSRSEADGN